MPRLQRGLLVPTNNEKGHFGKSEQGLMRMAEWKMSPPSPVSNRSADSVMVCVCLIFSSSPYRPTGAFCEWVTNGSILSNDFSK